MTAPRRIRRALVLMVMPLACSACVAPPSQSASAPDLKTDAKPDAKPDAPVVAPAAAPPTAAAADTVTRFIVGEADAPRFYVGAYEPAKAYFTPTEAEVAAFERDLPAFLAGAADPDARAIGEKLATYRRQFAGVVREEGRLIFGNYYCDTTIPASVPVMVDDGGSCYFNVLYEPGRQAFLRLSINGQG